jgi:hypothetical protein
MAVDPPPDFVFAVAKRRLTRESGSMRFFGQGSADRGIEALRQQRLRLIEIWNTIEPDVSRQQRPPLQQAIEQLQAQDVPDRGLLQATEMQIGRLLPERLLHSEFLLQFEKLRGRQSSKLVYFLDLRDQLFAAPPQRASDATTLRLKQVAYLELLNELQEGAIRRREELQRFAKIAFNLARVGVVCLAVSIFLILAMYQALALATPGSIWAYRIVVALITLLAVIAAGALGAFFSRILNYQLRGKDLTIEVIYQYFHQNVMFMRMVVGAIGALVFFGLMCSHLVSGDGLPDFDKLGFSAEGSFSAREFAKLLFWLFAAGFSERLVPSSLDQAVSKQAGDTSK